jgi:hypothetical protein
MLKKYTQNAREYFRRNNKFLKNDNIVDIKRNTVVDPKFLKQNKDNAKEAEGDIKINNDENNLNQKTEKQTPTIIPDIELKGGDMKMNNDENNNKQPQKTETQGGDIKLNNDENNFNKQPQKTERQTFTMIPDVELKGYAHDYLHNNVSFDFKYNFYPSPKILCCVRIIKRWMLVIISILTYSAINSCLSKKMVELRLIPLLLQTSAFESFSSLYLLNYILLDKPALKNTFIDIRRVVYSLDVDSSFDLVIEKNFVIKVVNFLINEV